MASEKRLIDANALMKEIKEQRRASRGSFPKRHYVVGDVLRSIRNAPTVDAVEVVHGRLGPSYIDEYYGEWKDCLECGTDNIWPSNYCRNCGAKMDGGAAE